MNDQPVAAPTLTEQAAAIDATEVAVRIMAQGARAAIGASTIEIVAMAKRLMALAVLADLTFDMLATADMVHAQRDPEARQALQRAVRQKIDVIGVSLEALGYGQDTQAEGETDGTAG